MNTEEKAKLEEGIRNIVREKKHLFELGENRTAKQEIRYRNLISLELNLLRKLQTLTRP